MTVTRNVPRRLSTCAAWNEHLRSEFVRLWGDARRMRVRASGLHSQLANGETISDATLKAWIRRGWIERGRCTDERTAYYHRTEGAPC